MCSSRNSLGGFLGFESWKVLNLKREVEIISLLDPNLEIYNPSEAVVANFQSIPTKKKKVRLGPGYSLGIPTKCQSLRLNTVLFRSKSV